MVLKSAASQELVQKVQQVEDRADRWPQQFELFSKPWNLAAWLGLTAIARELEREVTPTLWGGAQHQIAVTNLSAAAYQIYRAANRYGKPKSTAQESLRWSVSDALAEAVVQEAFGYAMLCSDFPAWHRDLYSLIEVNNDKVRFGVPEVKARQRFMAYEKGIRPNQRRTPAREQNGIDVDSALGAIVQRVFRTMEPVGVYGFRHDPPWDLEYALFDKYDNRLQETFRRSQALMLGDYSMEEFRKFYAALLALAGAREHICFLWHSQGNAIPCDDLLIVRTRNTWIKNINRLSSLSNEKIDQILKDLTLGDGEVPNRNLTVYPFVKMDNQGNLLAIIPGFVVASNPEENVLRVCTARNKHFADLANNTKEEETRADLQKALPGMQIYGPLKLQSTMPDVDLLMEDPADNHIVIAELKWLQLPMTLSARDERDKELRKGARQIAFIKKFLDSNPDYFVKTGKMHQPLTAYKIVTYCVLCRDYIADLQEDIAFVPYAPLRQKLVNEHLSLSKAMQYVTSDEWLPQAEADFAFQFHPRICNGVTVETEIFLPRYSEPLELVQR